MLRRSAGAPLLFALLGLASLPGCSRPDEGALEPLPAIIAPGEPERLPALEALLYPASLPEPAPDFAVAVSVVSPEGLRTARVPTDQRAARYIVESDWQLRAWVGRELPRTTWPLRGGPDRTFPGLTRNLAADDVARLNYLVDQIGVPEQPVLDVDPPANLSVPRDRLTYVIAVTQNQQRRWVMLDAQSAPPAARHLVRALASLSYQEDSR